MARDAYTRRQLTQDGYGMMGMHGEAPLAVVPGAPIMPGTPEAKKAYRKKVAAISAGAVALKV